MKDKLNFIVDKLVSDDKEWFLLNGIVVKDKGDYWILNYHQFADKNEHNILTRGLLISKKGEITSCPFFRFFNYGEPTAAKVTFSNADFIEKLDGSLIGVVFPGGDLQKPVWHFRNLLSAYQQDMEFAVKGFALEEEHHLLLSVESFLKQIPFEKAQLHDEVKKFCFIFEFISPANVIVTNYQPDQYGLYLIGTRHLDSLKELTEDELDELAKHVGVRRPRRWKADSYEAVIAMMSEFPPDYEGFVIRDKETGERIKIKSESYLMRHRLLTQLNYKKLVPLFLSGERAEIESYRPQTAKIFNEIQTSYESFCEKAEKILKYWQDKKVSRKEVALGIVGKEQREVCAVVFKLVETPLTDAERTEAVRETVRNMRTDALIEAWKLKDDLIESVIDEAMDI